MLFGNTITNHQGEIKLNKEFKARNQVLAAAIASLFMGQASSAFAQTPGADSAGDTANVVVTGTRVANRSALETTAPVDIIPREALEQGGVTEINQALSVSLPSMNFPRPGLTDGTDSVRPATLRGLAPDQTLVLVNSKRRHSAALVNVNGSIGRGSASADLNTIPSAIVRAVEVLRDGASAQYGSDAIAGVINVRLRTDSKGGEITANQGVRKTSFDFNAAPVPTGATWTPETSRDRTDGQTTNINAWKGYKLGDNGFLTIAAELKNQRHTERGGYDTRQQYPLVSGKFDPRELTINRYNAWSGEPELKQATLFANAGSTLDNGVKVYGWSSYQQRNTESAGFFRRPLQDENVLAIYPDGFLPLIAPRTDDFSAAGGATWNWGDWDMDTSLTYGKNKMAFTIENTLNRSLGANSKTEFDAGGFSYAQLTYNFSGVRKFDVAPLASPLNVAVGLEARNEIYEIFAGEPDSYRYGGELLKGAPTIPGSQVFPGFKPASAGEHSRQAVGAYVDLETQLTDKLLASVAVRGEHYSDFGNNVSGKLAARYDFTKAFALRGSVQNGFRAPSPQQQFFTTTSTNFISGVPYEITTFTPTDPVAVALGAKPLTPEKSKNFSFGAVMRFDHGINLTIDGYRIDIEDRIVLSENLTASNVRAFLVSKGFIGAGGGRFFLNGVDTTTKGVDVVLNVPLVTENAGKFNLTLAGNSNRTEVTRVPVPAAQLAGLNPVPILFNRNNVLGLEQGQPQNKITGNLGWQLESWGATARATRYGEALNASNTPSLDFVIPPRTLVDLELRKKLTKQLHVAIGADNVFDVYPEPNPASLNTTGASAFSSYSPFGRSGRFVYARVKYGFE